MREHRSRAGFAVRSADCNHFGKTRRYFCKIFVSLKCFYMQFSCFFKFGIIIPDCRRIHDAIDVFNLFVVNAYRHGNSERGQFFRFFSAFCVATADNRAEFVRKDGKCAHICSAYAYKTYFFALNKHISIYENGKNFVRRFQYSFMNMHRFLDNFLRFFDKI